jgi:hypothetical protein
MKSEMKLWPRSSKFKGCGSESLISFGMSPPKSIIGTGAQTNRNMNVIRSKFSIPVALPMTAL